MARGMVIQGEPFTYSTILVQICHNTSSDSRPLRKHVMKIEKQLISLVQERKSQLEELFELK